MNTVRTLFYKPIAELEVLLEAFVCANEKPTKQEVVSDWALM